MYHVDITADLNDEPPADQAPIRPAQQFEALQPRREPPDAEVLALSVGAVTESILVIRRGGFDLRLFFPMLLFIHRINAVIGFWLT